MAFVMGDKVTWKSQAAGSWKTKTGVIVEVVEARDTPNQILHHGRRDHESYIVEVTETHKTTGQPRKPVRYWPLVTALKKAR
jgi:hypothetical protein